MVLNVIYYSLISCDWGCYAAPFVGEERKTAGLMDGIWGLGKGMENKHTY